MDTPNSLVNTRHWTIVFIEEMDCTEIVWDLLLCSYQSHIVMQNPTQMKQKIICYRFITKVTFLLLNNLVL